MGTLHGHHKARPKSNGGNHEQSSADFSSFNTDSYSSNLSIIEQAVLRKTHSKTERSNQESETVTEPDYVDQTDLQEKSAATSYCGTKPDIDFSDSAQRRDILYSPVAYLQGTLMDKFFVAKRTRRSFIIEASNEKIVFFPERDQFYTTLKADALRSICTRKMKLIATRTLEKSEAKQIEQVVSPAKKLIDSDVFLWDVALLTSRGRIPSDVDPEAPVRLKLQPDLDRLTFVPYADQIASLWKKRAVSLLETASTLKIPQRYVFAFYNAANALRLISVMANPHKNKPHTEEAEISGKSHKFQHMFTRIIRR